VEFGDIQRYHVSVIPGSFGVRGPTFGRNDTPSEQIRPTHLPAVIRMFGGVTDTQTYIQATVSKPRLYPQIFLFGRSHPPCLLCRARKWTQEVHKEIGSSTDHVSGLPGTFLGGRGLRSIVP
jgi:hypothetical protein